MALLEILTVPNPLLKRKSEKVEKIDDALRKTLDDMLETMYEAPGVGLAAPQVGLLKRMVVIDVSPENAPKNPYKMINPVIVSHSDETVMHDEGCLSVPGISCEIERWSWVKVKCFDENFNEVIREGDGLFGRCMQHEIDHLDGITLFERLSPLDRLAKLEEYKAAVERGAKPGEC